MKPFTIQNKCHKKSVEERIMRDLRALVVWEIEHAEEEGFNISFEAYKKLFGENPLDSYYDQRRKYLDQINKKRYEKEMKGIEVE
ncbi:hypothetical protein DK1_000022 [Bacillus phage DK1]|uniref:Uncharacterized protein n=1 Tax=Bacillus phage DK1 TaxID=2500808 RepID=A0A3T0IIS5_9CAUD|nr:hypothetical protein H3016_gp22 [Bacillus phage DK1]AZU99726.1 hypothetical protein DK1_000022 [Bacillus phage DK1]